MPMEFSLQFFKSNAKKIKNKNEAWTNPMLNFYPIEHDRIKGLLCGPQWVITTRWSLTGTCDRKQEPDAILDLIHMKGPEIKFIKIQLVAKKSQFKYITHLNMLGMGVLRIWQVKKIKSIAG